MSAADRAELAEQRLQQRTELDMECLKFADDRRAIWEQLSQVCTRTKLPTVAHWDAMLYYRGQLP